MVHVIGNITDLTVGKYKSEFGLKCQRGKAVDRNHALLRRSLTSARRHGSSELQAANLKCHISLMSGKIRFWLQLSCIYTNTINSLISCRKPL